MRSTRVAGALLAMLMTAGVLAACSSGDGPKVIEPDAELVAVAEQMAAPDASGAIDGSVTIRGESAEVHGRFSGTELTGDGRGELDGEAPFTPRVPLDVVWRDGSFTSTRPVVPVRAPFGVWPTALLMPAGPNLAASAPVGFFAGALEPVFPPGLIDRVHDVEPTEKSVEVDGADARELTYRYRTVPFNAQVTVTFTVANGPRLHRVVVRSRVADLTSVLDYRVTLGADGPIDVTLASDAQSQGASLQPEGPFVAVRSGSDGGFAWRVLRAPGREGIECWRVETTPPVAVSSPNFADARCLAVRSDTDPLSEQVQVVLTSDGTASPAVVLATVPPGASNARLGFPGGRVVPAEIVDGLVVWAGENDANPVYLSTEIDGELVECATGAVSTENDLEDPRLADVRLGLAWICENP